MAGTRWRPLHPHRRAKGHRCGAVGDHHLGRMAALDPGHQAGQQGKLAGAIAAAAMTHAGHQKHPDKARTLVSAHFGPDTLVIVDGVQRADVRIGPAVIKDQLAAMHRKGRQIGVIGAVQRARGFFGGIFGVGEREIGDCIGRVRAEQQVVDGVQRHARAADFAVGGAGDENTDPFQFAACLQRADLQPLACIAARAVIDRADGCDLRRA